MESIISQMRGKINVLVFKFFWSIFIIILLIICFLLGRISKFLENSPTFVFESGEAQQTKEHRDELFGKISTSTIVASSGGKKYYFVWCKGAVNIKPEKKRYFDTEEQAQKAGYTIAANCK